MDANEHVKGVYATFGLALYLAQVLEHGLANALVYAELLPRRAGKPVPRKQWEVEFDAFLGLQFEQPLGRLVRALTRAVAVPSDLEGLLGDALKKRNFLSRHFFRERATPFMTHAGRETMIAELQQAQQLFERADTRLTDVIKPLGYRFGLTEETLKPFMDEYLGNIDTDL